eukprot:scaffold156990_cov31-Tisochrysis_lutea.AAC.1
MASGRPRAGRALPPPSPHLVVCTIAYYLEPNHQSEGIRTPNECFAVECLSLIMGVQIASGIGRSSMATGGLEDHTKPMVMGHGKHR